MASFPSLTVMKLASPAAAAEEVREEYNEKIFLYMKDLPSEKQMDFFTF